MSTVDEVILLGGARMPGLMEQVERLLEQASGADGPHLQASTAETLAAGGKRLRPLLVLICGGSKKDDGLVRAAAAVELIHMATLVHDDVVDNALLRRGRPTVFASAGRDAAAATGDFLFSRAFALLAANGDEEQVRALSDACVGLARGELAQRHDAYRMDIDEARYQLRCELKTARLFAAACRLGALASGRGAPELRALDAYGLRLGVAFQMLDDLLDVAGPAERTGKHRGTDLLDGTVTLPLILARARDRDLAATDLREVTTHADAEALCDRIAATGALGETRDRATALVQDAKQALSRSVDDGLERALAEVADRIAERYA
jgi:geranylgeranyl pyrophosphate synthase